MRRFAAFALLALCFCVSPRGAEAKSYHLSNYDVEVEVLASGDARVVESLTYAFSGGTFSHAHRTIPVAGFRDIEFVSLTSPDGPVTVDRAGVRSGWTRELRVGWSFPKTGGFRTFRLEYVVRGVLRSGAGKNVLDWQALGTEWEVPVHDADVEVRLPWVVETGLGTSPRASARLDDRGTVITFPSSDVTAEKGLRVVVEFPERQRMPDLGTSDFTGRLLSTLGVGTFVLAVALWSVWRRVGRVESRPVASAVAAYPDPDLSVAEALALSKHGWGAEASVAALVFDLARRGVLRLNARKKGGPFRTRSYEVRAEVVDRTAATEPWEAQLLDGLEREPRLEKLRLNTGLKQRVARGITAGLRRSGHVSKDREALRLRWIVGALTVTVLAAGFLVLVLVKVRPGLLAPAILSVAAGFGLLIVSASFETRTAEGLTLAKSFRNYGKWLKKEVGDLAGGDPSQAAARLTQSLPELLLSGSLDSRWIGKIKKRVEGKLLAFQVPEWMTLAGADGNPLDATTAAVECFRAFADSTVAVAAYAGGSAASGHGGGAGGGAGGGGGGAG